MIRPRKRTIFRSPFFGAVDPLAPPPGDGVVDDGDLLRVDGVALDDHPLRPVAHGDDPVGLFQPFPFDRADLFVDLLAAAVVFEGVDVEDERSAADPAGKEGGGDGHPVVGVDDVERKGAGEDTAGPAVADHLGDQVRAVNLAFSGNLLALRDTRFDNASDPGRDGAGKEGGGTFEPDERLGAVVPIGVGRGMRRRRRDLEKGRARLFVPRQDEGDPVAEAGQSRRYTVAGRAQAAAHPGRKFPSEHQDAHGVQAPYVLQGPSAFFTGASGLKKGSCPARICLNSLIRH